MPARYFGTFPIIEYANTSCRDLSRRVGLTNKALLEPTLFYPFEIQDGLRADVLAHSYYEDSYYDWLIYITNGIIDPYYDWNLSETDFQSFIAKKYGSTELALKKVHHYELNWSEDDINISNSYFESLPEKLKKYYVPNYGYNTKIISYKRRREDWITNTNKVIQFDITLQDSNVVFTVGEVVDIKDNSNNVIGGGEVVMSNTTAIIIHHISGNTSSNNIAYGETSTANATIDVSTTLVENLTDDEYVFWNPVSLYDYERAKNETNKHVRLIDANYSLEIYEELRKSILK